MMHRQFRMIVTLAMLALLASAMARPAHAQEKALDTARIVSVGGDVTEILYALGYDSKIVAVDTTSVYPPEALATKKSVGYMRALSTEGVLSLAPTVIIASDKSGPPEVVAALKASSVPYVAIGGADSPEGVETRIREVAAVVGAKDAGEALAGRVRDKFKAVLEHRAAVKTPVPVLFLLALNKDRVVAAGVGTAADEVIKLAGARNVAAGLHGYKPLSDEAAVELAPEFILVMNEARQPGASGTVPAETSIAGMRGLSTTPAARNNRIVKIDGAALLQFGPRTADAVRDLMKVLHPGTQSVGVGN